MHYSKFFGINFQNSEKRTYTICGIPQYLAPEIIRGKGYTEESDYWQLGVCLYELLTGDVPFGQDSQDPYEIYDEIQNKQLTFPCHIQDNEAKDLVTQLLDKQPQVRAPNKMNGLKNNQWFEDISWVLFIIVDFVLLGRNQELKNEGKDKIFETLVFTNTLKIKFKIDFESFGLKV